MKTINRFNVHRVWLTISIALAVFGFGGFGGPESNGLARGFSCIFFILFFIFNLLKGEKSDDEFKALDREKAAEIHDTSPALRLKRT